MPQFTLLHKEGDDFPLTHRLALYKQSSAKATEAEGDSASSLVPNPEGSPLDPEGWREAYSDFSFLPPFFF